MKRLRKFINLTHNDRLLLIRTLLLLGVVTVGLKLLPFQTLRRLLAKISQPTSNLQTAEKVPVDQVAWSVMVANHYIPTARCLANALATQVLLERRGYPTQLRIGFTRGKRGLMSAHAWVECEGRVVIGGGGNMARYIPVPIQALDNTDQKRWYSLS